MNTELLTIDQVAELLNVSRSTAYRLVENNEIEYACFGPRSTRIPRKAVDEYLAKTTVAPRWKTTTNDQTQETPSL